MPSVPTRQARVFLNGPFDKSYEPLAIALIAALVAMGKRPTCVLEVPGVGQVRIDRILKHIASCSLSIHDLSRVQRSLVGGKRIPRFNMPFELGLAMAVASFDRGRPPHGYLLLEAKAYRLQHTLSDVNGFDPYIHHGTQHGIIRCMLNAFGGESPQQIEMIGAITRDLGRFVAATKQRFRAPLMFEAEIFRRTVAAAADIVDLHRAAN
jgi:hypothetical protein